MKTNKLQSGFSIFTILVIIVVIGILGYVGYRGYDIVKSNIDADNAALSQPPVADDVPAVTAATEVVDTSDLDQASELLNQVDLDDSTDTSLLDSEMANF